MYEKEKVSNAPTPQDSDAKIQNFPEYALTDAEIIEALDRELATDEAGEEAENAYLIDLAKAYPEPKFTLGLNGVGTLPIGDIAAIKAKSKNGKSFLCSIFIAAMFGDKRFGFDSMMDEPTILYFDTEQNARNTAKLVRRVHQMMGWPTDENKDCFKAFSLRTMADAERLPYIVQAIERLKPQAVFIDGIADLIPDFNNIEDSCGLILELMRLSGQHDCVIVNVLHENKSKDDSGMKGHLGTLLLQKCSDVFQVKKEGVYFNVCETDCRNVPVCDFSFCIDGFGIPYPGEAPSVARLAEKEAALRKVLKKVFEGKPELIKDELAMNIAGYEGVSESTGKRRVVDAIKMELIEYEPRTRKYHFLE